MQPIRAALDRAPGSVWKRYINSARAASGKLYAFVSDNSAINDYGDLSTASPSVTGHFIEVPRAIAYYDELRRRSDEVYRVSPRGEEPVRRFSFDFSFNGYPLDYERSGPEVVIYKLRGCT